MGQKAQNPSQWAGVQSPSQQGAHHPISPEGAITTGQQVVEDIESGLTGWASGHTQLLQEHRLWHSINEEDGHTPPTPQQWEPGPGPPTPHNSYPGAQPPTTSKTRKGRNQSQAKEESPHSWNYHAQHPETSLPWVVDAYGRKFNLGDGMIA